MKRDWRYANRYFEHWVRGRLLYLFGVCFPPPKSTVDSSGSRPQISRIVLLRTSHNLGDVVMVSAVAEECRRLFPRAKLTLLVHVRMAELFQGHPAIDELLQFDHHWFFRPLAARRLLRKLRHGNFDVAVDCANVDAPSLANWLLTRLAQARDRVSFQHPEARKFVNILIEPQRDRHLISNQLRLLSPFAEPAAFRLPHIALTNEEIDAAQTQIGASPRVLIFIPPHTVKSWPLATFLELADLLCRDGVSLLLSFGPGDRRRNDVSVHALVSRWGDRTRVLPVLRLRQLAAVMSQCALFISNDCGPMHVAVAAGAPTLAVFLWANKRQHGYDDGQKHFVVEGADDAERLRKAHDVAREFLETKPGTS